MRHPPPIQKPKPLHPKFFKHVDKTDSCWFWNGHKDISGYGRIRLSPTPKKSKMFFVHRISWEIHNGNIPQGMDVLHSCDVRNCVNPSHLWLGTQKENNLDRDKKGRLNHAFGENHPGRKLNEKLVKEIRSKYKPMSCGQRILAKEYGVAPSLIYAIVTRKIWTHI